MKKIALVISAFTVCACAQTPADVQPIGQSRRAVPEVAQCIAQKWADASQTQVISQAIMANNAAVDVYVPGQQPPAGAAAIVRPQGGGSWVGMRSGGGGGSQASATVNACL
ncbi:MAG TPA: hypothetical protein VL689_20800 [Paraburkholderia sp.]|jgi:hypothetical protein|nr:hypothetical protein [Paraburkholderia sp.]